jgi:hypothetical protein
MPVQVCACTEQAGALSDACMLKLTLVQHPEAAERAAAKGNAQIEEWYPIPLS